MDPAYSYCPKIKHLLLDRGRKENRQVTPATLTLHDYSLAPEGHPLLSAPYLTLGQALEAIMHNQDTVALDEANSHSGADGSIHACGRGPHIHHGHCVQAGLWRREQRGSERGGRGQ